MILTDWRTCYKLTDAKGQTYNGCQWGPNVKNPHGVRSGVGGLCAGGFYHGYPSLELAVFLSPIHGNFDSPRAWRAKIRGAVEEDGILKLGATEMWTLEEVECPRPTTTQRVAFSVLVAVATIRATNVTIPGFEQWADEWLANANRTPEAAWEAARAARAAAGEAEAAWEAAGAARAAAWEAEAARAAAGEARAAAWEAEAAWEAAGEAARAAEADILLDSAVLALAETWE